MPLPETGRDHGWIEHSTSAEQPPAPPEPPRPEAGGAGGPGADPEAGRPPWEPYASAAYQYWSQRRGRGHRYDYRWPGPFPHRHWGSGRRRAGPPRRSRDDRMLGGVATGVARWIGIDPTLVRLGFVLAAIFSGFGIAVYIVMWLVLPAEGETASIASRAVHDGRGIVLALSLVPLIVLVVALSTALGVGWVSGLTVPVGIGVGGGILLWRNVGSEERSLVSHLVRPLGRLGLTGRGSWRTLLGRALIGLALVGGGAYLLSSNHATLRPLEGVGLVVAGAVVVFGPWWLRVARDLVDERQGRALAEERADMAARLHDSVLQTLALIQRRADQPGQVVKLARAQERELRSWLFDGRAPGGSDDEDVLLSEGVHRIEREIEDLHEVAVEAVVVGDCTLDDELRSLVAAGREATVNAAKWSGAPVVSLFVEVEPDEVSMFVRDKGVGFDIEHVGADRRGVAQSILARVERHGGRAEIRSTPGSGTEVGLHMPRREKR